MVSIMIADDSAATRQILKNIIATTGHNLVAEAKDGLETIEKIKSVKPDLLLLDYAMPKKNGLEVLTEIRGMNSAKVIMITASDQQDLIRDCSQMGVSAYVVKPFNANLVSKAISAVAKTIA